MARHTEMITIESEGSRDKGKTFVLEIMSAWTAERWANRAVFTLVGQPGGLENLANLGYTSLMRLPFDVYETLMNELLSNVKLMPDSQHPERLRPLVPSDFDEVTTIMEIKRWAFDQHVLFYTSGTPSE